MWKTVATLVSMVVSGVVTFYVAIFILMELGTRRHGNYEYYGQYPALFFGPAAIGFLAPGVIVWYLHKREQLRHSGDSISKCRQVALDNFRKSLKYQMPYGAGLIRIASEDNQVRLATNLSGGQGAEIVGSVFDAARTLRQQRRG